MKNSKIGFEEGNGGDSPSRLIDARIKDLKCWRGDTLARLRILIKQTLTYETVLGGTNHDRQDADLYAR